MRARHLTFMFLRAEPHAPGRHRMRGRNMPQPRSLLYALECKDIFAFNQACDSESIAGVRAAERSGARWRFSRAIHRKGSPQQPEATMQATWKPYEKHGTLSERSDLPDSVYAFPKQRKEPLTDETHVRNAIARFDQVIDVSDQDRELAFANIKKAATHYGVDMTETKWTELGRKPSTGRTAEDRRESAQKAAATRKSHER